MVRKPAIPDAVLLFALVSVPNACEDTNDNSIAAQVEEWRLAAKPKLEIGVAEGDERYQFINISSAWKKPNGDLVALDAGRPSLVFFDRSGTYVREAGSRGKGPGEMQSLVLAWPYRTDSIAVFDLQLRRVSVFDPVGEFARSFATPLSYTGTATMSATSFPCCTIMGSMANGRFVAQHVDEVSREPGPDRFSRMRLAWVSADGTQSEPIGEFPSRLMKYDAAERSGVTRYDGSRGFHATWRDRVAVGHSLDSVLTVIDAGGSSRTVPLPGQTVPYTSDLQARYEEAIRAELVARGGTGYHGTIESNMPQAYPPITPRYLEVRLSEEGDYWLARWAPRYGRIGGPRSYDVVLSDGTHRATIGLPPVARLLWMSRSEVLLMERDELDVQYLRLYDIEVVQRGTDKVAR